MGCGGVSSHMKWLSNSPQKWREFVFDEKDSRGQWEWFASFKSTLMQVFERLLGPSSFKYLKASLVCHQVSLSISNGGIGFISAKTIAPIIYLGSWTLVVFVINSKDLLDSRPFLLEAIGASNSSSLPFQPHLKLFRKFISTTTSLTPVWATYKEEKKSTSIDYFRKTTQPFISNMSFNSHQACLKSCKASHKNLAIYLPYHPMLLSTFKCFSFTLQTKLSLPIL
jgi:hypothetical protein